MTFELAKLTVLEWYDHTLVEGYSINEEDKTVQVLIGGKWMKVYPKEIKNV